MNILFRLDYGPGIGLGHFARCSALAREMMAHGHCVVFATRPSFRYPQEDIALDEDSDRFKLSKLPGTNWPRTSDAKTWLGASENTDALETKEICREEHVDLVVLDHYGIGEQWIAEWGSATSLLVLADGSAPAGATVVLDYGFDASTAKHARAIEAGAKLIGGTDYAPVSMQFEQYSTLGDISTEHEKSVLISLGGAAPDDKWATLISQISNSSTDLDFTLVGASPSVQKFAAGRNNVKIFSSTSGIASELQKSSFAIVNAGLTMYEMLASGKPGVALVTAENQKPSFQAARSGNFVQGGMLGEFSPQIALSGASDWGDFKFRELAWLKGRSLVDQFGPRRVLEKLGIATRGAENLRPLEPKDAPFLLRLANQTETLASSFSQHFIGPEEHRQWLSGQPSAKRQIWIYEISGTPVAQVRIDSEKGLNLLAYSVSSAFQGKGVAKRMLMNLFTLHVPALEVVAEVKPTNTSSLSILRQTGFQIVSASELRVELVRRPSW